MLTRCLIVVLFALYLSMKIHIFFYLVTLRRDSYLKVETTKIVCHVGFYSMTIKFVLMAIRFADLELLFILTVTVRHFGQSNVNTLYKDRCTNLIQFSSV